MRDLTIFDFNGRTVRNVMVDGEPWFVGKDVCGILDLGSHRERLSRLPDDERHGVTICDSIGRSQEAICINEPGVFRLITQSTKPEAEKFKHWLFHEVLPSIRKTGSYHLGKVLDPDEVKRNLEMVREARLTYGKLSAQALWEALGLPDIGGDKRDGAHRPDDQLSGQLADFIEEVTEQDPASRVTARDLYMLYRAWASAANVPIMTEAMFGIMMRKSGVRKEMGRVRVYCGIRIKHQARQALDSDK